MRSSPTPGPGRARRRHPPSPGWGSLACRVRSRGTDPLSESGVTWMSGSTKRQCDRALAPGVAAGVAAVPARALRLVGPRGRKNYIRVDSYQINRDPPHLFFQYFVSDIDAHSPGRLQRWWAAVVGALTAAGRTPRGWCPMARGAPIRCVWTYHAGPLLESLAGKR